MSRFSEQIQLFVGDDVEYPQKDDVLEDELNSDTEGNDDQLSLKEGI